MAPSVKVQASPRIGTGASSNPTQPAHQNPAKTNAPAQQVVTTGKGLQAKTAPTFNQNPGLAPKPPDNGSTKVINDQRQPTPPSVATAADVYGGTGKSTGG